MTNTLCDLFECEYII